MPFNEKLANRIRESLVDVPHVEEKKMFRGICFMVNGKMCICVGGDEMMCRIGPDNFEAALEQNGCRAMNHNGRTMTGFVFVNEEGMKTKNDFDRWIAWSLAFNKEAKASKKKTKAPEKKVKASKSKRK